MERAPYASSSSSLGRRCDDASFSSSSSYLRSRQLGRANVTAETGSQCSLGGTPLNGSLPQQLQAGRSSEAFNRFYPLSQQRTKQQQVVSSSASGRIMMQVSVPS